MPNAFLFIRNICFRISCFFMSEIGFGVIVTGVTCVGRRRFKCAQATPLFCKTRAKVSRRAVFLHFRAKKSGEPSI